MNILLKIFMWSLQFFSLYFFVFWMLTFFEKEDAFRREKLLAKLKYFPTVAVIIPAYNEEKNVRKTIDSVMNLDYPNDKIEVYAVDDGSKDSTLEIMREAARFYRGRHFKVISHENMGKAASINDVLNKIDTEYFACLDADSFVDPLTLKKQLSLFQELSNPKLAIVTPAMKVYKPRNLLQRMQRIEYITVMFFARMMSRLNVLFVAPGPFSIYRTDIIKKVGKFDAKSMTEDQEIAYRLQDKHYQIKQCFNGYVYTVSPSTIKGFIKQRKRWFKGGFLTILKNRHLVLNRAYGDFGLLQLPFNLFSFLLTSFVLFFTGYFVVRPLYLAFVNLAALNFNIINYISTLEFSFNILDIRFGALVILYFSFILVILMLFFSHRNANEKVFSNGFLSVIGYLLFYNIFISFICFISLIELIFRVRQRW